MNNDIWKNTSVSPDETYHVLDGKPLYSARFGSVMKFHSPGLAPVLDGSGAYHILTDGTPAYRERYVRVFGYYEDRASVQSEDGWFHIGVDGTPMYIDRYAWCGNFQDGLCTVRTHDNHYFHIGLTGSPVYMERYRYAGDFRDGIAVVQAENGLHTHINASGALIHGKWFPDLDVFHKNYARARDDDGWMHVDRQGRPIYKRRFASAEPFYNGQARVERFDGGLEVMDEAGNPVVQLRPSRRSEFSALSGDMIGFWKTQTICSAVELGIFETLPGTANQAASRCELAPKRTQRLLRALGELGLVKLEAGTWSLTSRGNYLRKDNPLTLAGAAPEYGRYFGELWASLPEAMKANGNWKPHDIFAQVAEDDRRTLEHHRMLQSYARHDYEHVPDALDLNGNETVIDAGGGVGVLAEKLLQKHPDLQVVLLERPEVIAQVSLDNGIASRLAIREADFFRSWDVQGDAVILSRVLHDWDDRNAEIILRHARSALRAGGRLFIIEMVLSEDNMSGGMCDLHLLMATGGQERTAAEYSSLLDRSGFRLSEICRLPSIPSVITGVAL